MPVEYHRVDFDCANEAHRAFIPALGVTIAYRDHATLIDGVYALYEREYGPNDIRIIHPENCDLKVPA